MAIFQWDQFHLDWFISKFKDEIYIEARTVQRKYRRKKGEMKPSTQDFRNLMRLVVKNRLARVVKGCVSSKKYKIRMVSDSYPYTQNLFDEEILSYPCLANLIVEINDFIEYSFPGLKLQNNDKIHQIRDEVVMQSKIYWSAFSAYNFFGGDFDMAFEEVGISADEITIIPMDYYSGQINSLILTYQALKLAAPELNKALNSTTPELVKNLSMPRLNRVNEKYNIFFILAIHSNICLQLLILMKDENQDYEKSYRTLYNKMKESLNYLKEGAIEALSHNRSYQYQSLVYNISFWRQLPAISSNVEVRKAVQECEQAFIESGPLSLTYIEKNINRSSR